MAEPAQYPKWHPRQDEIEELQRSIDASVKNAKSKIEDARGQYARGELAAMGESIRSALDALAESAGYFTDLEKAFITPKFGEGDNLLSKNAIKS